jgi:mono/diheme cytochrome c family protein
MSTAPRIQSARIVATLVMLVVILSGEAALAAGSSPPVDFAKHIHPLFQSTCYECHGPEKQKGNLRLDSRSAALKGGKSGKAIVPHDPAKSLLLERVLSKDDDERMPAKHDPLSGQQIALLRTWIEQGAHWPDSLAGVNVETGAHWAYVKPVRPQIPKISNPGWAKNGIDYFIAARLEKEGLRPSPEAAKETLIRRVTLDLTGLPPTPAEIDAFLADQSPDAYEKVVDRLLRSPAYGERWARPWLDLARYADTNGYEADKRRTIWKYRDWVINALNADMPFDRFTVEQIAGDMLPAPSGAEGPSPTIDQRIATGFHRNTMTNEEGGVDKAEQRWLVLIDRVDTTASVWLGSTLACAQCHDHKFDPFTTKDFYSFLAFWEKGDETQLKLPTAEQEKAAKELSAELVRAERGLKRRTSELDEAQSKWESESIERFATTAPTTKPATSAPALPSDVVAALRSPVASRTGAQKKLLAEHFRSRDPEFKKLTAQVAELKAKQKSLDTAIVSTLVLQEKATPEPPRTFIRIRGAYLSKGDEVTANTPAFLPPLAPGEAPNRLALAKWLVSPENPLTARVTVNRFWQEIFGHGIVETAEDFGTQGDRPTHPELLDYLATQFVNPTFSRDRQGSAPHPWSMKAIHRLIVTSATYRQSSRVTPALMEKDPYNHLYARGPRFRMEAEMIRDNALAASGLLVEKVGGPSVMPYQPDGIWNLPYNADKWANAKGDDQYRRGLYTFWRRTAPYPTFATLDATSREYCTVRRVRTNTPLQALNLLNDPAFFEAAKALATRTLKEAPDTTEGRIDYALRLTTARHSTPAERSRLASLYDQQLAQFQKDPESAKQVADTPERAAWTMVCNVLLNLDETLTKE